jgi:hypothetical protein
MPLVDASARGFSFAFNPFLQPEHVHEQVHQTKGDDEDETEGDAHQGGKGTNDRRDAANEKQGAGRSSAFFGSHCLHSSSGDSGQQITKNRPTKKPTAVPRAPQAS